MFLSVFKYISFKALFLGVKLGYADSSSYSYHIWQQLQQQQQPGQAESPTPHGKTTLQA
jgi:hypothetical protein